MQDVSLYLVPTPIGNLNDITLRAIETLRKVDLILAEDTRTSRKLLVHHGLSKPLQSYHSFNEHKTVADLVSRLKGGTTMALISDAGTPSISDPGFLLVRECLQQAVRLECLPGPTAFVPALVKSGLPADRFVFEGFLPHKKGRKIRLSALANEKRTVILYESPHRLVKTLTQLAEVMEPERQASVSRELTKLYEETVNDSLDNLIKYFSRGVVKGEITLIIQGKL